MWEGGRGKHQGGLPGGESIQGLEEHFSSQGFTPEFLIGTNCHMLLSLSPRSHPLGQVSSSPPILLLRNGFKEEERLSQGHTAGA